MHPLQQVVQFKDRNSCLIVCECVALYAGKGSKSQGGAVPPWAPQEGMMCSHLCFPRPQQLPGPEAKLFVEMACVAVSHHTACPVALSIYWNITDNYRCNLLKRVSAFI